MTDSGRRSISVLCLSPGCSAQVAIVLCAISGCHLSAQSSPPIAAPGTPIGCQAQKPASAPAPQSPAGAEPDVTEPDVAKADVVASAPAQASGSTTQSGGQSTGRQTKRILGIMPNFEAVSANAHPPPMCAVDKFWLTTEGTFDYSSFISVGMQAAALQATNQYREFHEGAAAYGRYYWHTFADAVVENYMVGAIFPAITHEDPRYYTLDRGGFYRRACYAVSRLWITRKDSGTATFNSSEIFGSGLAAEVSTYYYPRQERGAGKAAERWASQFLNDGVSNIIQEFWPDIHDKFTHRRWLTGRMF
jgi:hypothetical protein